jgi:hypothetical protein
MMCVVCSVCSFTCNKTVLSSNSGTYYEPTAKFGSMKCNDAPQRLAYLCTLRIIKVVQFFLSINIGIYEIQLSKSMDLSE